MPLVNILKGKRFLYWDEYYPVQYAHKGCVPVADFLTVFQGKETEGPPGTGVGRRANKQERRHRKSADGELTDHRMGGQCRLMM